MFAVSQHQNIDYEHTLATIWPERSALYLSMLYTVVRL